MVMLQVCSMEAKDPERRDVPEIGVGQDPAPVVVRLQLLFSAPAKDGKSGESVASVHPVVGRSDFTRSARSQREALVEDDVRKEEPT